MRGDEVVPLLDERRRRRDGRVEAAQDVPHPAVAEGLQGVQLAGEELLGDQRGLRAPRLDLLGARHQLLGTGGQRHVLARHSLAGLDDAGVGQAGGGEGGRVLAGGELRGPDGVGAGRGEVAPHLGLVLGAQRGPPVLARKREVVGGQSRLGLEVVAVGEHRVGAVVGGDAADDGAEVVDVALQDLGLRTGPAVRLGLVREDRDRQPQAGGGGQEAVGDRVGGIESEQIHPHERGAFGIGGGAWGGRDGGRGWAVGTAAHPLGLSSWAAARRWPSPRRRACARRPGCRCRTSRSRPARRRPCGP